MSFGRLVVSEVHLFWWMEGGYLKDAWIGVFVCVVE